MPAMHEVVFFRVISTPVVQAGRHAARGSTDSVRLN
jgi:hypothetical protein